MSVIDIINVNSQQDAPLPTWVNKVKQWKKICSDTLGLDSAPCSTFIPCYDDLDSEWLVGYIENMYEPPIPGSPLSQLVFTQLHSMIVPRSSIICLDTYIGKIDEFDGPAAFAKTLESVDTTKPPPLNLTRAVLSHRLTRTDETSRVTETVILPYIGGQANEKIIWTDSASRQAQHTHTHNDDPQRNGLIEFLDALCGIADVIAKKHGDTDREKLKVFSPQEIAAMLRKAMIPLGLPLHVVVLGDGEPKVIPATRF